MQDDLFVKRAEEGKQAVEYQAPQRILYSDQEKTASEQNKLKAGGLPSPNNTVNRQSSKSVPRRMTVKKEDQVASDIPS